MIPDMPDGTENTDPEFASGVWRHIIVELLDDEYVGRTHGNRRTHDAGCKGPICRKAAREHARRRNKSAASPEFKTLDLLVEAWTPVAIGKIIWAREKMIEELSGRVGE